MIYVKIADLFSDKILSGEYQAKSRNMNTVVRALDSK